MIPSEVPMHALLLLLFAFFLRLCFGFSSSIPFHWDGFISLFSYLQLYHDHSLALAQSINHLEYWYYPASLFSHRGHGISLFPFPKLKLAYSIGFILFYT